MEFPEGRKLPRFLSLPPAWPLARLLIPIKNLVKQMETLLQCYCFETVAMCRHHERQDAYVHRLAKDLAQFLALFLAETVTELLQWRVSLPIQRASGRKQCAPLDTEVLGTSYLYGIIACLWPL